MSTVPTFDQFIEPLLRHLASRREPEKSSDAHEAMARAMNLTEAQKAEELPSRRQPVYKNRIGWAHDRLKRAGLSTSPKRGYWQLTDQGRAFAADHAAGIPAEVVKQMAFRPVKAKLADDGEDDDQVADETVEPADATQTPEERLRAAHLELQERIRGELLDLIRNASPAFFEDLVLDVLHKMGYGSQRNSLVRTGGSGDGGIDGVVSLDRLGLEKVYVQAKRYAEDNHVGRPAIQGFFGALAGRRATKGVFITTSKFSREARDFASTASDSIVLINGERLAQLMIEYSVGVSRAESYNVVKIDSDYFDEDS